MYDVSMAMDPYIDVGWGVCGLCILPLDSHEEKFRGLRSVICWKILFFGLLS